MVTPRINGCHQGLEKFDKAAEKIQARGLRRH
jgi:hypothetical protein